MNTDSKHSDVLEGEVIGAAPQKEQKRSRRKKSDFDIFDIPVFRKLKRNCLLSLLSFVILTALAIYYGNGLLFLLAVLLPPWLFSQKKF